MLCMLRPCTFAVLPVKQAQSCKLFGPYQNRAWPYISKSDHKDTADSFSSRRYIVQAVSSSTGGRNRNAPGMSDWPCELSALESAREFVRNAAKRGGKVVLAPDRDADGLCAGGKRYSYNVCFFICHCGVRKCTGMHCCTLCHF